MSLSIQKTIKTKGGGPLEKTKILLSHILLIILSALSVFLALPGIIEIPLLAWVALVPFLFVLARAELFEAVFLGFIFGTIHYGTNGHWVLNIETAPLIAWCALVITYGFTHFPLFCALTVVSRKICPRLYILNFVIFWVITDWLIREKIFAFPIFNLAESQYRFTTLLQIAEMGSIYAITLLILLGNAAVFVLLKNIGNLKALKRISPESVLVTAFILMFCATTIYGIWRLNTYGIRENFNKKSNILVVQPNFVHGFPELQNPIYRLEKLIELTKNKIASSQTKPDLIIWPEVTINTFVFRENEKGELTEFDPVLFGRISDFVYKIQKPVVSGNYIKPPDDTKFFYNSMTLVSPDNPVQWYNKNKPLWIAEYFPDFMGPFKIYANKQGYGLKLPGKKFVTFSTNGLKFGTLICSENGLGDLSRNHVLSGAQILINPSDDSSFRNDVETHQHEILNLFRAIENRIVVIGAGNVGGTKIVSPTGKIAEELPHLVAGVILQDVPIATKHHKTPFTRYGNLTIYFLVALLLLEFLFIRKVKS